MRIQSLSVVVPTKRCVNDCPFCVSKMGNSFTVNQIESNRRFQRLYEEDYLNRLEFSRDNGCNTIIFTGNGEPLQNMHFLERFANWNRMISNPFRWLELQSTGVFIDDSSLRWLRNQVRISTISLSISDMFESDNNNIIIGVAEKLKFDLDFICREIKRYDFNLRLSLNIINTMNGKSIEEIFTRARNLGADQLTFRKMYTSGENEEARWLSENAIEPESEINTFMDRPEQFGAVPRNLIPFGAVQYSMKNISVVVDKNCMSEGLARDFKYLILEKDCKLYSRWDDPASLIF